MSVVGGLELGGWDVAAVLVEAAVVEPVDPLGGGDLDVIDGPPGPARFDQLGLVQAVDRLGQRVVERVADRPDGGGDAGLGEPFAVLGSPCIATPRSLCATTDSRSVATAPSRCRVQMACSRASSTSWVVMRGAAPPAQDPAGVGVDHERDVDPPGPGRDVGHVGHPQPVRRGRGEPARDQVIAPAARPGRRSWSS